MLYPHEKISEVQRRQMTTVCESNIHCLATKGNFDDCQKILKNLFTDSDLLKKTNVAAVNSINWLRIIAQTVYYYWAALQLQDDFKKINFIIPSGNFGNVYAASVAKRMGLEIGKLHIATNSNDILHRIILNGDMSLQSVKKTQSPSMDIQISSNFERQLFESIGSDSAKVNLIMQEFSNTGKCELDKETVNHLSGYYISSSVDDKTTLKTIKYFYDTYKYVADPHTATGLNVLRSIEKIEEPCISLACAHPSKFSSAIVESIGKHPEYPDSLKNIFEKEEKFTILDNNINDVKKYILSYL